MKWVFDYRSFFNPELDCIKVWFGGVLVGHLSSEPAARELQARLSGTSIASGDPDPDPATAPAPAADPALPSSALPVADASLQPAAPSDTPSVLLDDPPAAQPGDIAIPAMVPHAGTLPEVVRVTCEGPMHNAICKVLGYQEGGSIRVRVESPGDHQGKETGLYGNQYEEYKPKGT